MSTVSASPGEPPARSQPLVWDAPLRLFHWLLVLCFSGAYLTAESDGWHAVHVTLGYTLAGLVVLRLIWGVLGTRHARFSSFVTGPSAVLAYVRSIRRTRFESHAGHNPAGAWAILAMLALGLGVAGSGWAVDTLGEAFEDLHEVLANVMLGLVGVHVAAVLVSSWLHRENLVKAMVTGRKPARFEEGIGRSRRGVAVCLALLVLGFWAWQWHDPPIARTPTGHAERGGADKDD